MKAYIGTKVILAEPMDETTFRLRERNGEGLLESGDRPGYKVIYPDGYVSWSPKDVFEQAYREVSGDEAAMIATAQEAHTEADPPTGVTEGISVSRVTP